MAVRRQWAQVLVWQLQLQRLAQWEWFRTGRLLRVPRLVETEAVTLARRPARMMLEAMGRTTLLGRSRKPPRVSVCLLGSITSVVVRKY